MLWDSRSSRCFMGMGRSAPRRRIVDAALALDPEEARLLGGHVRRQRARRVHVAYRDVALFPGGRVGEVVLGEGAMNLAVGPVDDREDLDPPVLDADNGEALARARLRPPQAREPRAGA